jgi:UDP-2-acetamido-3-amino-2,3-dideoxy-glucuronate N-acetyltransferase
MKGACRVAAIGLGHWGRNLVRNLDALGVLAALHDSAPETRARFAAQYPAAAMRENLDAVWRDPSIDAVVIAAPAAAHGALVRAALEAGKHVFVEKPLCLDVAEARDLAALAAARGRVLMVGHLLLYHPAFRALKAAFDAGRLGRLRYVYSTRLSLGKIRREENALWSFAPHDISMILQLAGALPQRVVATGGQYLHPGVADTTLSHLAFAGDVQAHIFVSWIHPYKDQRLVVVGEEAMAVFNDVAAGPEKLALYPHRARWEGEIPMVAQAAAEPIPYGAEEPLRVECQAFVDAVTTGRTPPSHAGEGIAVLRVLDACQRALTGGMPVEMAP